jgi:hypothetical protein
VALESGHARSGDVVYYQGHPVSGANAATFTAQSGLPDGADARDDKATYALGRKLKPPK